MILAASGMYALLLAPQVLGSGNDSRIVDLNVAGSMFNNDSTTAGYATYDAGTGAISRLTLFNFQNITSSGNVNQTFTIPAEIFSNATALKLPHVDPSHVTVKYLTAPHLNEQFDISWAGQTYHTTGDGIMIADKSGRPGIGVLDCSSGCSVDVPGPGVALVYVAAAEPSNTSKSVSSRQRELMNIFTLTLLVLAVTSCMSLG